MLFSMRICTNYSACTKGYLTFNGIAVLANITIIIQGIILFYWEGKKKVLAILFFNFWNDLSY